MTETWRKLAFALLLFGMVGITTELYLLEHFEEVQQRFPLVLLGVGLPLAAWTFLKPGRKVVRALQALMGLYMVSGLAGMYFHLQSNMEFELELHPDVTGVELLVESLHGAMPALAPGTMIQIGLLGLLACFRHPALGGGADEIDPS